MRNYREILRAMRERTANEGAKPQESHVSKPPNIRPDEEDFLAEFPIQQALEDINDKEWNGMGEVQLMNGHEAHYLKPDPILHTTGHDPKSSWGERVYGWELSYDEEAQGLDRRCFVNVAFRQSTGFYSIDVRSDLSSTVLFRAKLSRYGSPFDDFSHQEEVYEKILNTLALDCEQREIRRRRPQDLLR